MHVSQDLSCCPCFVVGDGARILFYEDLFWRSSIMLSLSKSNQSCESSDD